MIVIVSTGARHCMSEPSSEMNDSEGRGSNPAQLAVAAYSPIRALA
jgi:hypothetical protein